MKLLFKNIDKKGTGTVRLIAEEAEDMWHAYNLISIGDYLRSTTIRRVINESAGGLTSTQRVHTTLTICVKSLDFDTQAGVLRVKGINSEENQFVKMGAYHTIDLELQRKFDITKQEWDSVSIDRIDEACDPNQNADLAAVVMQEGLAHICLILSSMTLVKTKIEMSIPRKRKGLCSNHDKSLDKFFERIVQGLLTHINFDVVKAIIVGSPGFIKDQFMQFMIAYATQNIQTAKVLLDNKAKFLPIHCSSGFKHSIKEMFEDPNLAGRLTDTKALGEVNAIEAFYKMLKTEPARAFYGVKHVEAAIESDAVDTLLICDSLFRSQELMERKRYVKIVDAVRENSGVVKIFSSLHVSGEQLRQLTGIAAILRFPLPDIEDIVSDSDEDEDNETNIVNGHICNNIEPEAEEPKPKAPKTTTQPKQESINISTASATTTESAKKEVKKSSAIAAPKGSTQKKNKFAGKKVYDDDDYGDGYDDYGYDDDFL